MSRFDHPSSAPPQRRRIVRSAPGEAEDAWRWADGHRGRPAAAPPPSAGRAAVKAMRTLTKQLSPAMAELDANWEAIVGPQLAAYTRPEKFQSGAGGLTLAVRARGPAAALVEAQAPRILERVARYSGKAARRLKIVQGPLNESFAPGRVRSRRITKVARLDDGRKNLDALMEDWARAVAQREGAAAGDDHGKD